MAFYKVEYAKGVKKDLVRLPKGIQMRALEIVEGVLAADPHSGRPLTGVYKGLWKYRLGDYRIIYRIEGDRLAIFVLRIRHRKDVYEGIVF